MYLTPLKVNVDLYQRRLQGKNVSVPKYSKEVCTESVGRPPARTQKQKQWSTYKISSYVNRLKERDCWDLIPVSSSHYIISLCTIETLLCQKTSKIENFYSTNLKEIKYCQWK